MPTPTCTRCDADCAPESDLCHEHTAERACFGEHPTACACWGCAKWFARNTGIKALYLRTAKAQRSTVEFLRVAAGEAFHRAMMNTIADASRAATIASIEAQGCEVAA